MERFLRTASDYWPLWGRWIQLRDRVWHLTPSLQITTDMGDTVLSLTWVKWGFHIGRKI